MNLKQYILTGILCMSLVFPSVGYVYAASPADNSLSIEQALEKAYKTNPDLRKAALNVEKAEIIRNDAADRVKWIPTEGMVMPTYQQVVNGYQQAEIGYQTAKKVENSARDGITCGVVSAYSSAVTNYNNMELARIKLGDAKLQLTMSSVARAVGTLSDFDYEKAQVGVKHLEEGYELSKAKYEGSISKLRSLLNENANWKPDLNSRPILAQYNRNELGIEIARGLSESRIVWSAEAQLKIEESQQYLVIPGQPFELQNLNLELAQVDYEKSKRDTRATIEELYYILDTMEGQIAVAEKAYLTASKDVQIAQLRYDLGLIARADLSTVQAAEQNARLSLENARATLAQYKAQYAYLTAQQVYSADDWN
ncbi:Outer membrane efflux protein [Syntrophomonas zehnderi OL-4]|uniref:Outer membrane efflux protein n=1 Tax=Syntrophomonas zehnderi OL-4 TaxID=690567 RepID=A0A0E4GCD6_9FIRM|nr:TolC family protein [Syntrophomonas zehnderi]CFX11901.1 Outer membrane efflux protein [Syntrophomonas zehnderi OL-4]